MTADLYAEQKARIREAIEAAKASDHPFLALRQMEQRAMQAWPHLVTVMRAEAGIEPEPVDADALAFANWVVDAIRKAREGLH